MLSAAGAHCVCRSLVGGGAASVRGWLIILCIHTMRIGPPQGGSLRTLRAAAVGGDVESMLAAG